VTRPPRVRQERTWPRAGAEGREARCRCSGAGGLASCAAAGLPRRPAARWKGRGAAGAPCRTPRGPAHHTRGLRQGRCPGARRSRSDIARAARTGQLSGCRSRRGGPRHRGSGRPGPGARRRPALDVPASRPGRVWGARPAARAPLAPSVHSASHGVCYIQPVRKGRRGPDIRGGRRRAPQRATSLRRRSVPGRPVPIALAWGRTAGVPRAWRGPSGRGRSRVPPTCQPTRTDPR
jgi:hypothetical protein